MSPKSTVGGALACALLVTCTSPPPAYSTPSLEATIIRCAAVGYIHGTAPHTWHTTSLTRAEELTQEQAREVANPAPYVPETIAAGKKHYLRLCQNCHGKDGRALDNFDFEATDLTNPDVYRYGATDGEIFRSIKQGAGYDMPAFQLQLEDGQIWQLVQFLRSIGPAQLRPEPAGGG